MGKRERSKKGRIEWAQWAKEKGVTGRTIVD